MSSPPFGRSSSLLARNSLWNLAGQGAPLVVALFSIPLLVRGLGIDRFGILTLAWMVVGYFSLFDLGLGRALTKLVAERLGSGDTRAISSLVWTALALMAALGALGAATAAALAPWLVHDVLTIPDALRSETTTAFSLLAFSIPVVVLTVALRGVLEANQRFAAVNALRIPMGVFNFIGPLFTMLFSPSLVAVVSVLAGGRLVAAIIHYWLCSRLLHQQMTPFRLSRELVRPLLTLGGWMTVSNLVGPLMVYLDRFLIGTLLSMGAVSFYVTPYEVVTRLWIIPTALVGVLFPAFATSFSSDRHRSAELLDRGSRYVFLSMFPITITIVTFSRFGLGAWLGSEFASQSNRVMQCLALGVLINSMAHIPFALIQGAGRPDLTARLHLIELPTYLVLLWWAVPTFGIVGAAISWVVRVAVDTVAIFVIAGRLVSDRRPLLRSARYTSAGIALSLVAALLDGGITGVAFLLTLSVLYVPFAWRYLLRPEDRARLKLWTGPLYGDRGSNST